jgi:putative component of membrane protein insertase Oxa1/YidC/SpoIIIJ protein YidD
MTVLLLLLLVLDGTPADLTEHRVEAGISDALFAQYRLLFRDLLGRTCAFSPSCSQYGQEAMRSLGPVLGTMVALDRWTRCHRGASSSPVYTSGPDGRALDPLAPMEETTCWGRSLLPF